MHISKTKSHFQSKTVPNEPLMMVFASNKEHIILTSPNILKDENRIIYMFKSNTEFD